jgi:hypothetical protein
MYYDDIERFVGRCGGEVFDVTRYEQVNQLTVRAQFIELQQIEMNDVENVEVRYSKNHVVFDIDYDVPKIQC